MREEWLKLREKLLFGTKIEKYVSECESIRRKYMEVHRDLLEGTAT